MLVRKCLLVIIFSVFPILSGENAIDAQLEKCKTENESTQGQVECMAQAEADWDKELNKNYKQLMSLLDEEGKQELKTAQVKWIAFRDAESNARTAVARKTQGTIVRLYCAGNRLEMTRQRALELAEYISWIN
jgi:uncharacterized protein YecT (DUF1311 family)